MMFSELDASGYKHNEHFYKVEFGDILSKIIACYYLMLSDNVSLKNNENSIRDVLLINYLRNNTIRRKIELTNYLFDREVPEDKTVGRTDIKIQTSNTFQDPDAYYIIECKRLDDSNPRGTTGLNAKYIQHGLTRFASKTYSSHYKINGMIGFVVASIDIHKNITSINSLLTTSFKQVNTIQKLSSCNIVKGFDFSYCSTHSVDGEEIIIYHLMFDFSKNMQ